MNGNVGILWPINSEEDLDEWLDLKQKNVLVFATNQFTEENVDRANVNGDVEGVLVLRNGRKPDQFSAGPVDPNRDQSLFPKGSHRWNPAGSEKGWALKALPFPVALVSHSHSPLVDERAAANKASPSQWPRHAVRMTSWMYAGSNAIECLRRGRCEPVGGKSVWAAFHPPRAGKWLAVVTAMDGGAFFRDTAVAADAAVSGSVAQLLAALAVGQVPQKWFTRQVVWLWATGEAWGLVGSTRWVNDLRHPKAAPLNALQWDDLEGVIEASQVGQLDNRKIYAHRYTRDDVSPVQDEMETAARDAATKTDMSLGWPLRTELPPGSVMPFLKEKPSLAALLFSEYNQNYSNPYYYSQFDDSSNVNLTSICASAQFLAQTLINLATNESDSINITIDCGENSLAAKLLYCLTVSMDCDLAKEYFGDVMVEPQPSQYASVFRRRQVISTSAILLFNAIYEATGIRSTSAKCETSEDCSAGKCMRGSCIVSETFWHDAVSLAFDVENDFQPTEFWDTHPTWVESVWSTPTLEIFVMGNPSTDMIVFSIGVVEVIASVGIIYFLKKSFVKRFKSN